jgi:hypothetical protein
MSVLWVAALVIIATAISALKAAIGGMIREEACTRLGRIPFALIRLAARRVPAGMREDLAAEWTAELEFVLTGTDGMPLTRLVRGIRYSAGLLKSACEITDGLRGEPADGVARECTTPVLCRLRLAGGFLLVTGQVAEMMVV